MEWIWMDGLYGYRYRYELYGCDYLPNQKMMDDTYFKNTNPLNHLTWLLIYFWTKKSYFELISYIFILILHNLF